MTADAEPVAGYRRDIDGLRAVAVLAVLWFHSGIAGLPGGYAGVDIFFVISGYLITGIICRESAAGTFQFRRFYKRRFRRIAPALVVVLGASLLAGFVLLLPGDLVRLGQGALAALGMVPNIDYWMSGGGGYFDFGKRIAPPLLHTWSLGVEEQFYLFYPLLLLVAMRWRIVRPAIVGAAALSFALCVIAVAHAPVAAFYLLPMRAWELALGAFPALGLLPVPARLRQLCAAIGLVMIGAGLVLLDSTGRTPFWLVAVPAAGTALKIAAGPSTIPGRMLAILPLTGIGRISYSLYLWHLPIFALTAEALATAKLPIAIVAVCTVATIILAWATWRWVEQPARRRTMPFRRVAAATIAGAAVVAIGSLVAIVDFGLAGRFPREALARFAQRYDYTALAVSCERMPITDIDRKCLIGRGAPTAAIWGDSHAAADAEGIAAALHQPTLVITASDCVPSRALSPTVEQNCADRNRAVLELLQHRPAITTIVLVANWPMYSRTPAAADSLWRGVQEAIDAMPGRRLVLLAGTPQPGVDVPWASAIRARWGRPPLSWPCPPLRIPVTGVIVADLSSAFCAYPKPWLLFSDNNHPSLTANREVIAPAVRRVLAASAFDPARTAPYPIKP